MEDPTALFVYFTLPYLIFLTPFAIAALTMFFVLILNNDDDSEQH